MLTDYLVIFAVLVVVFAAGYYAHKFIARNEQHIETLELHATVRRHEARIAELHKQLDDAFDEHDRVERSRQQLEVDFRTTAQHYAQCEADLIVTRGRLTEAADELLAYGVDIRADWDEQQTDAVEYVEEHPSLFIAVAKKQREEHPERAGNTETFHMPLTPEQEQELQQALPTVEAWNAWTRPLPQLEPARVPAQRDGES